jgi:hypothetical protein
MARKRIGADPTALPESTAKLPELPASDYESLKAEFERAYNGDVTMDEAEKLAAKFLTAQMEVAERLRGGRLDTKIRKRGLKSMKSQVRMDEIKKHDKKPTEGFLEDVVNLDPQVSALEDAFDLAEVETEYLETILGIFKDAHIYFRGTAKGRFE